MTNNSITLIILDSLIEKVNQYNIIAIVQTEEQRREFSEIQLNQFIEEEERRIEAEHPFYEGNNQVNYQNWMLNRRLDEVNFESPWSVDHSIPTGDAALDESEDEMEDCFIPIEEFLENDCPTTDEYGTDDDEAILNVIDFSEEINLNDLY